VQVIKPLAPTRPQLTEILSLLATMSSSLSESLAMKHVQRALASAEKSAHPVATLLKTLRKNNESQPVARSAHFQDRVQHLRYKYFGEHASKKDFNIVPATSANGKEYIIHFRLKHGQTTETLKCLCSALEENDLFFSNEDIDQP
jgi:ParB family chromosome partitioning protein